jgi:hypothetical protein
MDSKGPKPFWSENRNDVGRSDFNDVLRVSVFRARIAREAKEAASFVLWLLAGLALAVAIIILTAITLGYAV